MDKEKDNVNGENAVSDDEIAKEALTRGEIVQPAKDDTSKGGSLSGESFGFDGNKRDELLGNDSGGKKKGGRFGRFVRNFLIAVIVLVGVAYAGGCYYFSGRYFPDTYVNGINASFMTPSELEKKVKAKTEGYVLSLKGRDGVSDRLSGSEIGLKFVEDGAASRIKKEQGYLLWPAAFFSRSDFNGKLNFSFDEEKFKEIVSGFNIFKKENIKAPSNPYPQYDSKKEEWVVNPGNPGSDPVTSKVDAFVANEVKNEVSEASYPDSVYRAPDRSTDDGALLAAVDELNKYAKMHVGYDLVWAKYTLSPEKIASFFDVDKDYKVSLNRDKVREFVRHLIRNYSTYGDTRKVKSMSKGKVISVSGGTYGWLIDREKETDALMKVIESGKSVDNRRPVYYQKGVVDAKDDLGNTYIEIDLADQHMWFVKDGKAIADTAIVSGNPKNGDETPTGIYPLNYKERNATLKGPGYSSPVKYWMPFNGNIGIHDADWQPVYGGSRYLVAGSHGCINTPLESMKVFYKNAFEGMPVVVHK